VRDQHDAAEAVRFDEELYLPLERGALAHRDHVFGEGGGAAGDGHPVVAREAEAAVQELVDLVAVPPVAAIYGRRPDPLGVERDVADERRLGRPDALRAEGQRGRVNAAQVHLLYVLRVQQRRHPAPPGF
jgi:hypothetical protein